ncbi:hypothetical protein CSKR_102606 [Clonorchis sinensis]|uniref:Sterol regulatory element-binding protein 1 n=1 Tax=Clonorchis sinensis TaxID=79923 RepID=A0A8T1M7P5_CLOSI|nr:hypothetical protein CSKR_102606 [Clonorchis sinensis]
MDVLDSLSDIFDDPLLNEFTDKLLSDIDLTELNGISGDISQSQDDGVIDVSESEYKIGSDGEGRWDCSNSTTLEALLKSRNPVSCVPPAPDLCSDLTKASPSVTHLKVRDISNINLSSNHRRNSLPTLKSDPEKPLLPKDGASGVKPRLIRDYLEKCETEDPLSKHPRRYFIGYANRPHQTGCKDAHEFSIHSNPDTADTCGWYPDQTDRKFDDGAESPYDRSKGADKNNRRAPHNAIEKRYRASINGRIDELRKILIPYPTSDAKMNKSAVLRQAIDRIRELQEMNERLQAEVLTLRSLHSSCGRLHNGSPESGIVSFEPSPSSSTNISSLDFGGFTSPPLSSDTSCGSSYHNGVSITSRTISNDHPMTLLDALDAKQNNWPIDGEISPQLVDTSDVRSLGNTQCSEVSFDDGVDLVTSAEAHQMFVFSPSYGPADFSRTVGQDHASYRHLSAPSERNPYSMNTTLSLPSHTRNSHDKSAHLVNGYHGKRPLCPIQSGPVKVRRQTLVAPSANNSQRPSGLIIPCAAQLSGKLSDSSTSPPNPKALPVVRQLLCSPTVNVPPTTNALSSQMVESTAHYVHGQASGFNGVAARTTLCVAALCLITVDLTTLSGSGSHTTDSVGSQSPSSRRLLSSWSELLAPSTTPWSVWFIYLLQWIAATFLCFWACQKRDLWAIFPAIKRSPSNRRLQPPDIAKTWNEAKLAVTQGSWSTAENKLLICLSELGTPLSKSIGMTKYPLRARATAWLRIFARTISIICFRYPRLLWTVRFWGKKPAAPIAVQAAEPGPTPTDVRLRLLEVYLLAKDNPNEYQIECAVPESLEWTELITCCVQDFIDASVEMLKHARKQSDHSLLRMESLAKSGFMLSIALNRGCGFPRFITRFPIRWISRTLQLLSTSDSGPWCQWASNPIVHSLLVNTSSTRPMCPSWLSASNHCTMEATLRAVLQQRIFDHCLRVLVFEPSKNCSKLEPYINVLVQFNAAKSSSSGRIETPIASTPQDADAKNVWWARFIHAAWYNRARCATLPTQMGESSTTCTFPVLERPPQDVLNCPHTGTLAESAWLTYCSLQHLQHAGTSSFTRDSISDCQRAAMLLRKCLQQLSELNSTHGAPDQSVIDDSENMNPPLFWMLACELLVADWQLSFLSAALMPSQCNLLEETVAQSATSKQTLIAFNTALWVMLQASSLLSATTPEWITKKLSYSETINRLLSGANPVHSRLVLMHACQNSPILTNANIRSRILESTLSTRGSEQPYLLSNSSSPAAATVGGMTTPAPSVSNSRLLDFDPITLKNTLSCIRPSRCSVLTQSPGQ